MSPTEDTYVDVLATFKQSYEKINVLELKIYKLFTAKLYGNSNKRELQQKIDQAEEEIIAISASTAMQKCIGKIKNYGKSSRAVDVYLQFWLDLREKQIKHCQELQLEVIEKEPGTLQQQVEYAEKKKIEIKHLLKNHNHHQREVYLFDMVKNFAKNVADLLVNQRIDDDELKVAICIFEIYQDKQDWFNYKITLLKLSK